MKKKLRVVTIMKSKRLFYHYNGDIITGPNPYLKGDCTNLFGDCSRIVGNASNIYGDCTYLSGDITYLKGDVTDIHGRATNIYGNLDDCEITGKDKEGFVMIKDLVAHT